MTSTTSYAVPFYNAAAPLLFIGARRGLCPPSAHSAVVLTMIAWIGAAATASAEGDLKPVAPTSPNSTCSQPKPAAPRLPTLSAPAKIVEGQRVLLRYEYPQSEWRLDDDEADWPAYVRIDDVDYECVHHLALFDDEGRVGFLDLNDGILALAGRGGRKTMAFPPGKHRVALVYKDLHVRDPGGPDHSIHFCGRNGSRRRFRCGRATAHSCCASKKTAEAWLGRMCCSKSSRARIRIMLGARAFAMIPFFSPLIRSSDIPMSLSDIRRRTSAHEPVTPSATNRGWCVSTSCPNWMCKWKS